MNKYLFNYETFRTLEKPLSAKERPKILFRFPGPCGLHELSQGNLKTLAPQELPNVFLFKDRYAIVNQGIEHFGVFTVINPEYFDAICLDDDSLNSLNYKPEDHGRIFLGANKAVEEKTDFIWLPSRIYKSKSVWSTTDPHDLNEVTISPSYEDERKHAFEDVNQYMEEVAQIEKALGVQKTPWFLKEARERKSILKKTGIKSQWTSET